MADFPLISDNSKTCVGSAWSNETPRWGDPCFSLSFDASGVGALSDVKAIAKVMSGTYWQAVNDNYPNLGYFNPLATAIYYGVSAINYAKILTSAFIATIMTKLWPDTNGCTTKLGRDAYESLTFIKEVSSTVGQPPDSLIAGLDYEIAYRCQTKIPGGGELNTMRLQGHITDEEWQFGQKLNGNCLPWQQRVYDTMATNFNIGEVFKLWNMGAISTLHLPNWLRNNGVTDLSMVDGYKLMYEVVPSLGDCFESMIKNADDPAILDKLGLDEDFEDRFKGRTKLWLQRTGLTDDMLKYKWAAHRPAIEQRVILRMYQGSVIDYDEMVSLFRFNGHPRKVAEKLATSIKRAYAPKVAAAAGQATLTEMESAYMQGAIDSDTFKQLLDSVGVPQENQDNYVQTADFRRSSKRTTAQTKWIRSAFMKGRIGDDELKDMLIDAGVDSSAADTMATDLITEKGYSNRQLQIAQLCKFVSSGYITMSEYLDRARNLNFSETDAALMAQSCAEDILKKRNTEKEKEQRKALALAEKNHRKQITRQRELNALYRKKFPCKEKTKPDCAEGVTPPIYPEIADIFAE